MRRLQSADPVVIPIDFRPAATEPRLGFNLLPASLDVVWRKGDDGRLTQVWSLADERRIVPMAGVRSRKA